MMSSKTAKSAAETGIRPYFDRSKRFSIVLAVMVGNLFACSIFFSLRNGQGVSFGLVLAIIEERNKDERAEK